jgi:hypothetical protein
MPNRISEDEMQKIGELVQGDWKSDTAKKGIAEYRSRVGRAAAQIADIMGDIPSAK